MIWLQHSHLCHSRARVWRTRGIPNPAPGQGNKTGILRAAATRENDKQRIRQDHDRHYNMQDSIDRRTSAL
jgi:CHASE1-domain containing sensor protein